MLNDGKEGGPSSKDLQHQTKLMGIYHIEDSGHRCSSNIMQMGSSYRCSLNKHHDGWAHQNLETETLWL